MVKWQLEWNNSSLSFERFGALLIKRGLEKHFIPSLSLNTEGTFPWIKFITNICRRWLQLTRLNGQLHVCKWPIIFVCSLEGVFACRNKYKAKEIFAGQFNYQSNSSLTRYTVNTSNRYFRTSLHTG